MEAYQGQAAAGGPEREVHRHTFVGVDVSLLEPDEFPGYEEMRGLAEDLLQNTVDLSAAHASDTRSLDVEIWNRAGHRLPSGATVDREVWLELAVTNASGAVVLESGTLDERGDLRVDDATHTTRPGTDPALVLFSQKLYFDEALTDAGGTGRRRVEFLWEPNAEESTLVPTGGLARRSYDLAALGSGSYTATLRLLFRSFPPHLLRTLEERAGLDPAVKGRVPTVEMESIRVDFTVE